MKRSSLRIKNMPMSHTGEAISVEVDLALQTIKKPLMGQTIGMYIFNNL